MFELSLILGVMMLIIGFAVLFDRKRMLGTLKQLLENAPVILVLGIINIILGLAVLTVEHRLSLDLVGLFALVGWLMFLRGVFVVWFPDELMNFARRKLKNEGFATLCGMVHLILGGVLTYFAYSLVV